jgi:ABC-type uncharacterized transport system YnjBCD ATPase subunit/DNA-binding transcriptional ArsR family regulator
MGMRWLRRSVRMFGGFYEPSPGAVYPTLQWLEDEGLVRSEVVDGRRVYSLTDAGEKYLAERGGRVGETSRGLQHGAPAGPRYLQPGRRLAQTVMLLMAEGDPGKMRQAAEILDEARRRSCGAGDTMTDAIVVENLVKAFGGLVAVDNISFTVSDGELFGFLGPNGAGKTTTINILTTLLKPTSGRALVGGYDVEKQPDRVRRVVGLVPQELTVDDDLTGWENLMLQAGLYHIPRQEARKRALELLELVGLKEAAHKKVETYSGGMRKRLRPHLRPHAQTPDTLPRRADPRPRRPDTGSRMGLYQTPQKRDGDDDLHDHPLHG